MANKRLLLDDVSAGNLSVRLQSWTVESRRQQFANSPNDVRSVWLRQTHQPIDTELHVTKYTHDIYAAYNKTKYLTMQHRLNTADTKPIKRFTVNFTLQTLSNDARNSLTHASQSYRFAKTIQEAHLSLKSPRRICAICNFFSNKGSRDHWTVFCRTQ